MDAARLKQQAAERAVEFIESGMVVGLGHGSTTAFAIERLAHRLAAGELLDIVCIPCSAEVERHARELEIPLATLNERPTIDLTIDGADEVDPRMNLIKGGGGALLREKVVASASRREIIVVDGSKLSPALGTRFALPIEVVPFARVVEQGCLESLGAKVTLRAANAGSDVPFLTDQGNVILDASFGPIHEPSMLAEALDARPGIVGHGLFIDLATDLVVADLAGVRHYRPGDDLGILPV
ncbi:ribose-5-phosphate isomerase RpiA [Candidatus Bipolaricaulota bacterium]